MVGIYALWFEEPEMIYVGQSQDINRRFTEHLYKLRKDKHTNYKVQNCYLKYGEPELVILETCVIEVLNDLEIIWTTEFNSIKKGLNIIEAGEVGYGVNSNASKYSKLQILLTFRSLYLTKLTNKEIALNLGVKPNLVSDIKNKKSHLWLKVIYPNLYNKVLNRTSDYETTLGGKETKFISPKGLIFIVSNITKFVRENYPKELGSLNFGLAKVRSGNRKQFKGWKLYKE